jgi:hypothetical protein
MKSDLYELSEAELIEFDQLYEGTIGEEGFYVLKAKLQLDEILQHKYLVYKMLRQEITKDGLASIVLKARLNTLDRKNRNKKQWILSASLISSLMLICMIWMFNSRPSKNSQIYNQFKDSETGLSIQMKAGNADDLKDVMVDIAKSDYGSALENLNQIVINDTTLYYSGYCEERLENFVKAETIYNSLKNSKSDFIRHKSRFRFALIHLKNGEKTARDEFEIIASEPANPYASIAAEILKSLNRH